MPEATWVAARDLMGDLELIPLPETAIPLEAIVLIKAIDENGDVGWFTRETDTLTQVEAIGALDVAHAAALANMVDGFFYEYGEDDEDEGDI